MQLVFQYVHGLEEDLLLAGGELVEYPGKRVRRAVQPLPDQGVLSRSDLDNITFSVEAIQPSSGGVTVTGKLTVRDRTRPVSFPATVSVAGSGEAWLDAEIQVNRADFGLTWSQMGMASMKNTITVHAVFNRRNR